MRVVLRIAHFAKGHLTYAALVDYALARNHSFSLVWRDQHRFAPSAQEVAERLRPHLEEQHHSDQWPGTRLVGHAAWIRRYRLEEAAADVLKERASIYDWLVPDWPEDLAFYLPDGDGWFGSISHEQDAFINDAKIEVQQLLESVPGLELEEDRTTG